MPTLKQYVNDPGHYAVATVNRHVVAFQLTEEGESRLLEDLCLIAGDRFDRAVLMELIQRRWAYTNHSGPGPIVVDEPVSGAPDVEHEHAARLDRTVELRLESTDVRALDATISNLVQVLSQERIEIQGPIPLKTRIERYRTTSTMGTSVASIHTHRRFLKISSSLPATVQNVTVPPDVSLGIKEAVEIVKVED